jgi:hypothetical protein
MLTQMRPQFTHGDTVEILGTERIANVIDILGIRDGEFFYSVDILETVEELPEFFIREEPESNLAPALPDAPPAGL